VEESCIFDDDVFKAKKNVSRKYQSEKNGKPEAEKRRGFNNQRRGFNAKRRGTDDVDGRAGDDSDVINNDNIPIVVGNSAGSVNGDNNLNGESAIQGGTDIRDGDSTNIVSEDVTDNNKTDDDWIDDILEVLKDVYSAGLCYYGIPQLKLKK
jgi:hypothetical protein